MPATIGREFSFLVDLNGGTAPEDWARLGARRDGSLSLSTSLVDTTSADDRGFTASVIGSRAWSASFTCNYDPNGAAIHWILTQQLNTVQSDFRLHVRFDEPSGQQWVGYARVESLEPSFPQDAPAEISVSLTGDGQLELR